MVVLLLIFFCSTGVWTQGLHLEPLCQLYFCKELFKVGGSRGTISPGWFEPWSSWSLPLEYIVNFLRSHYSVL
jgi:hypothetical protein